MILEQFSDRSDTPAAEMVDIIGLSAGIAAQLHQALGCLHQILFIEDALRKRKIHLQALIELVTSDDSQVIALDIEEKSLEELFGIIDARGIAGTHSAVNFLEGIIRSMGRIALETVDQISVAVRDVGEFNILDFCLNHGFHMGLVQLEKFLNNSNAVGIDNGFEGIVSGDVILFEELSRRESLEFISRADNVSVGIVADGAEECCDQEFAASALAVEINIDKIIDIELDFHPGTAIGNDSVGVKSSAAGMASFFEADARGSVQLADDNSFGSVDDEGTAIGHHRDFTDVDVLVHNGVFIFKSEINMKRCTVGIAVLYAVNHVLFWEAHGIGDELQDHLFIKTFNGKNFIEDFLESLVFPFFCRNIKLKE